jgi:annexin A7/11
MGSQSPNTRCKVYLRYNELYEQELVKLMKSECGKRTFGTALMYLAVEPVSAECMMIEKACSGMGTNELLLFTILCGRTNTEMELLKKKYFAVYTKDLGRDLDSELGGDLEKLVFNVLQAAEEEFDEDFHTEAKMEEDVEKLHEAGIGRFGTDEQGLFKIICGSPPDYLKKMNMAYADKYGYTLMKALEKELGGHAREAAMFTLGMKIKPYETVANLIDKACRGFGTNELLLTTVLIRYQPIMKEVMEAHQKLYSQSVPDRVKSETSGDYEALLLEIIKTGEAM